MFKNINMSAIPVDIVSDDYEFNNFVVRHNKVMGKTSDYLIKLKEGFISNIKLMSTSNPRVVGIYYWKYEALFGFKCMFSGFDVGVIDDDDTLGLEFHIYVKPEGEYADMSAIDTFKETDARFTTIINNPKEG